MCVFFLQTISQWPQWNLLTFKAEEGGGDNETMCECHHPERWQVVFGVSFGYYTGKSVHGISCSGLPISTQLFSLGKSRSYFVIYSSCCCCCVNKVYWSALFLFPGSGQQVRTISLFLSVKRPLSALLNLSWNPFSFQRVTLQAWPRVCGLAAIKLLFLTNQQKILCFLARLDRRTICLLTLYTMGWPDS